MKKNVSISLIVLGVLLVFLFIVFSGCDYIRNRKYTEKVFDVRVELWKGNKTEINIWENANNLSYNSEENIYSFYVDGKLIEVDNYDSVILAEVGAPKPMNIENEEYKGKKFNLTILQGKDVIKVWEEIEIESVDSEIIHFLYNGLDVTVLPAANHTIIIEETTVGK